MSPSQAFSSQPSGGRSGRHPGRDERVERALGVLGPDEEVDVVLGRRPAARPRREPAAEQYGTSASRSAAAARFIDSISSGKLSAGV